MNINSHDRALWVESTTYMVPRVHKKYNQSRKPMSDPTQKENQIQFKSTWTWAYKQSSLTRPRNKWSNNSMSRS